MASASHLCYNGGINALFFASFIVVFTKIFQCICSLMTIVLLLMAKIGADVTERRQFYQPLKNNVR